MSSPFIVPIVEGQGEVEALPLLIRRIYREFLPGVDPKINPPSRIKAGSFLRNVDYFRKYVALAAAKAAQSSGLVLILLDCEDECPAILGPKLSQEANSVRHGTQVVVTLAHREYETWFLAAAESLRGFIGLPSHLVPPPSPENIRGAKEWLGRHMPITYDPIVHQVRLTSRFDLHSAMTVPSFKRLVEKLTAFGSTP
ncbi:MAG: DUF4276 family protein [Chthoniobacteraceae bacterium]